jgi:hypothetical protein
MLRAKNPPSLPPFPGPDRPACSARLFNNYLAVSESRRGPCHVSGGAHRRPLRGGRGCAEEERWPRQPRRPRCYWADTWYTRPASCARRTLSRLFRRLPPASPWSPCTRRQSWHRHGDPESAGRATLQGSSPGR